eukprot:366564-Chlamydomonas_euryale.AAC.7
MPKQFLSHCMLGGGRVHWGMVASTVNHWVMRWLLPFECMFIKHNQDQSWMNQFEGSMKPRALPGIAAKAASDSEPLVRKFSSTTNVVFDELDAATIQAYVESGEPFGKAGAYGIQGIAGRCNCTLPHVLRPHPVEDWQSAFPGVTSLLIAAGSFVRCVDGCYFNVMGFPLNAFCKEMVDLIDNGDLDISS